ncbi:hypothetical protein JOC85_001757 [Bacillus mesophilus]|uniref:Uncharacterized protein n=1 Tax=Bacillus mesophilus TaxID=1808955 RepID=A0A6M0Q5D4_9BACI|nr:hypothetical protein [Bacillus mesophilus]MBM7660985.1 hypothetical protein [Bacillus mesophilus]NEY71473.1 hypothetical protein [Bacillus mesophilus]
MKNKQWKSKKVVLMVALLLFLLISTVTNPTTQDYIHFEEKNFGNPLPENVRIAEADFFIFSVYAATPKEAIDEFGIVHLGFMGQFFQVSDGQFDDSIWKDYLK